MPTRTTVTVSGIDDIACHGGAILTPASVTIRYDRRQTPDVQVSGPTRYGTGPNTESTWATWCFYTCTCRTWLAELVEHHRPKGHRTWEHYEHSAWEIVVGLWINTDDAPDPHRDYAAALKAALADAGDCNVMQSTLRQALAA